MRDLESSICPVERKPTEHVVPEEVIVDETKPGKRNKKGKNFRIVQVKDL